VSLFALPLLRLDTEQLSAVETAGRICAHFALPSAPAR